MTLLDVVGATLLSVGLLFAAGATILILFACWLGKKVDGFIPPAQWSDVPEHMDERRNERDVQIADWQCTRCDTLRSRITRYCGNPRDVGCKAVGTQACPMVPINSVGDVLPLP